MDPESRRQAIITAGLYFLLTQWTPTTGHQLREEARRKFAVAGLVSLFVIKLKWMRIQTMVFDTLNWFDDVGE
jgi:hypothetical protein